MIVNTTSARTKRWPGASYFLGWASNFLRVLARRVSMQFGYDLNYYLLLPDSSALNRTFSLAPPALAS